MSKLIKVLAVIAVALAVLIICLRVFDTLRSSRISSETAEAVTTTTVTVASPAVSDTKTDEVNAAEASPAVTKDPMLVPPIMVDYKALLDQNEDVYCWLYIEDTPINYVVLQSTDNDYYLYHDINKEYSTYGSLFVDYRCAKDFGDINTIIFGHDMVNGTEFGTLEKYFDSEYYDEHPTMWVFARDGIYRVDILSCYMHDSYSALYNFPIKAEEFLPVLQDSIDRSYLSDYVPDENSHYITLSTCNDAYEDARTAVIGVMNYVGDYSDFE